ncbi:methyltransferase-like protein 17, mitochondrial [Dunckerocampus dactyliophorus]|uniref:methyltransferase-like protein 17, mitochondrial n=1 Tax=Dunckerocampus dactyliophorus TaxID=161453 RepID=UPI002404962C|nr:methyltransferase-like protein 17, mitochondrial [Dunckerocampus dactyliophorus]
MATRRYTYCVFCQRASVVRILSKSMTAAANLQTNIDFLKGEPHKRHPGVTHLKTLRLPEDLQTAARSIIHRAQVAQLPDRTRNLTNFLWSRKRAVEDSTLRQKALSLEKELWKKAVEKAGNVDKQVLVDRIQREVFSELRRTIYRWTPLKYNEELGVVYMAARMAGGYAAVRRALNEIKKRDASFAPQSLLDFGSGLGTVAWASHSFWADTLKEMVCVDSSGPMNILAERLLKGDDENADTRMKHVYFRQFLPMSPKVQFDLVTSAYTLSEIPTTKEREEAVLTLWRKTSSYLLFVENGTKEGHQILMEARDTLLQKKEKTIHDTRPPSVFAPCPHEEACPKLALTPVLPCNFHQMYMPLYGHNSQTEKFSYLILTRERPPEAYRNGEVEWSRLLASPQARTRHVHCRLCCPDGQLKHVVVTTRKHSRDVYRCARSSEWGDQLPLIPDVDNEMIQNEEE